MKSVKNVDKMLFPGRANRMNLRGESKDEEGRAWKLWKFFHASSWWQIDSLSLFLTISFCSVNPTRKNFHNFSNVHTHARLLIQENLKAFSFRVGSHKINARQRSRFKRMLQPFELSSLNWNFNSQLRQSISKVLQVFASTARAFEFNAAKNELTLESTKLFE